ncbi:MAG: shikimate dehydrogenase [Granulosicoccus sp.]|jgi:shikimate dehydrogenase
MINQYTVIGQPIAHSLSPVVHQLFGELTQRMINYNRTEATPDTFAQTVIDLQASGARGCNVTAPFKELAVSVCDRLAPLALRAGSVNTIHMHRDGSKIGHNTDGLGLVADIRTNKRRDLESSRLLLLGAGGAARGVLAPLLATKPAELHIANRTAAKAEVLASLFDDLGSITSSGYDNIPADRPYDVIINATTPTAGGGMPTLPEGLVDRSTLVYDMTYATTDTAFMQWGRSLGGSANNGLGMLVEQAAESYLIWEGVRPKTRLVYPRLHEMLS